MNMGIRKVHPFECHGEVKKFSKVLWNFIMYLTFCQKVHFIVHGEVNDKNAALSWLHLQCSCTPHTI